jgi:hypothetical protein
MAAMKKLMRIIFSLLLITHIGTALADARVFELTTPNPQEVVDTLRQTYGDKIRVDLVQQRLVVVGSKQQLDEIGAVLVKLDPTPAALRLTIREQPPADETPGTITYSTTTNNGYTIDTVEGALVALDYSQLSQRVSGFGAGAPYRGWLIDIEEKPTLLQSITLQVRAPSRKAIITVGYTKEENQQRRVFGNTVAGDLGSWIPLLPQQEVPQQGAPEQEVPADGTITSGPKRGNQLYVRVQKNYSKAKTRTQN